jgi:P2-related tail formation protein
MTNKTTKLTTNAKPVQSEAVSLSSLIFPISKKEIKLAITLTTILEVLNVLHRYRSSQIYILLNNS